MINQTVASALFFTVITFSFLFCVARLVGLTI